MDSEGTPRAASEYHITVPLSQHIICIIWISYPNRKIILESNINLPSVGDITA